MNQNLAQASFPVENLSSNDMACGFSGSQGVGRVLSIKNSDELTFEFRSWANDPTKPRLDPSHKGPCAAYLKKVDSAIKDPGNGDGWFKIWDDGYDGSQWCTEKMIANGGFLSIKLPDGLEGGNYLLRPELLALHAADKGDPQFYVGCAQVFLDNPTGTKKPASTVSIPGYVKAGDKPVAFNIWQTPMALPYPIPGPAVAELTSSGSTASDAQTSQTEGLKPAGCLVQNANWCGFEVPSYTDETGCWASGQKCWDQANDCWNSAEKEATGNAGCALWEAKCQKINDNCNAKNFNGPPANAPTPAPSSINPPTPIATSGGGDAAAPASSSAPSSSAAATSAAATSAAPASSAAPTTSQAAAVQQQAAPSPKPTTMMTSYVAPNGAVVQTYYETVVETDVDVVTMWARTPSSPRKHRHARFHE